jgi:hypothetical protein
MVVAFELRTATGMQHCNTGDSLRRRVDVGDVYDNAIPDDDVTPDDGLR